MLAPGGIEGKGVEEEEKAREERSRTNGVGSSRN